MPFLVITQLVFSKKNFWKCKKLSTMEISSLLVFYIVHLFDIILFFMMCHVFAGGDQEKHLVMRELESIRKDQSSIFQEYAALELKYRS